MGEVGNKEDKRAKPWVGGAAQRRAPEHLLGAGATGLAAPPCLLLLTLRLTKLRGQRDEMLLLFLQIIKPLNMVDLFSSPFHPSQSISTSGLIYPSQTLSLSPKLLSKLSTIIKKQLFTGVVPPPKTKLSLTLPEEGTRELLQNYSLPHRLEMRSEVRPKQSHPHFKVSGCRSCGTECKKNTCQMCVQKVFITMMTSEEGLK